MILSQLKPFYDSMIKEISFFLCRTTTSKQNSTNCNSSECILGAGICRIILMFSTHSAIKRLILIRLQHRLSLMLIKQKKVAEPGHWCSTDVLTFTGCPYGLCFWPQTLQQNFCFLTNQHTFNPQLVAEKRTVEKNHSKHHKKQTPQA